VLVSLGSGGVPEVRIFDGLSGGLFRDFLVYAPSPSVPPPASPTGAFGAVPITPPTNPYLDGVHVSCVRAPGREVLVTAPGSGQAPVQVLDGMSLALLDNFFAYDPAFLGGVFVGGA
jgi:hypothetical protein